MILSVVSGIFFFASVLMLLAVGPNSISVLTESALLGRGAGLRAKKGVPTGLPVSTAAVPLGVAAIFQTSALAFIVLDMTRSRANADGLRLEMGAFVSGVGYARGTRAVVLGEPAR